jgi:BTB/POZ domain-containing protein
MTAPASYKYMFLNQNDIPVVEECLKKNLKPELQDRYKEFIPIVASRIDFICKELFEAIAKSFKNGYSSSNELKALGKDFTDLIVNVFKRKYNIPLVISFENNQASNYVYQSLFPDTNTTIFKFYWTLQHTFTLDTSFTHSKRYNFDPSSSSKIFYNHAKSGTKTDLILIGSDDQQIHAHRLILMLNNSYFEAMLKNGLKETNTGVITLPYSSSCLSKFVQFIYEGTFDATTLSCEELEELLALSHETKTEELFNYCVDLTHEFLKDKCMPPETILHIISSAYLYNLQEVLPACLKQAEDLEKMSQINNARATPLVKCDVIDWENIKKEHCVDLLEIAIKNSYVNVQKKLKEVINRSLTTPKQIKTD